MAMAEICTKCSIEAEVFHEGDQPDQGRHYIGYSSWRLALMLGATCRNGYSSIGNLFRVLDALHQTGGSVKFRLVVHSLCQA